MKKIVFLSSILFIFLFCIVLGSCSTKKYKFGTGNIGGNYYSYGTELAKELNAKYNSKITAVSSQGSIANLDLVAKGFYGMGIVQSNDLSEAIEEGKTDGYHYNKTLFTEYFQIIVKDTSTINDINDLIGKKVSIGEEDSGTANVAVKVLSAGLGEEASKIEKVNMNFSDAAIALKNETIDAMVVVSSGVTSAIKELESSTKLKYVHLNDSVYTALVNSTSGFIKTSINANTLDSQIIDEETIGVYAVLVFNNDFNKDLEASIIEYIENNNENIQNISFGNDVKNEEKGIYKLSLNMYLTLGLGILVLFLGMFLRKKIKFFEKFCIPAPVIGGLIFCILSLLLYIFKIVEFNFDETLKNVAMMIFFTSIGFQANLKVLKKGGLGLIKLLGCVVVLIFIQNAAAIGIANLLNVDSLVALCTGSIPMVGGHGTSSAFGTVLEEMGVNGATTIATAAATFGLVAGSLMGGPLGERLINKYKLKPTDIKDELLEEEEIENQGKIKTYAPAVYQLSIAMGIGVIVSYLLSLTGLTFPAYIGSMIVAAIMRNISEYGKKWHTPMKEIDDIGSISLGLFLGMAMITLKLWQLADLALPLVVLLISQVVICFLFARFVIFYVIGKNYDSAVIVAGACGFGMGATPNAMANMDSITSKHGPSVEAYLIVPIIGAMLVDFVNSLIITFFINIL